MAPEPTFTLYAYATREWLVSDGEKYSAHLVHPKQNANNFALCMQIVEKRNGNS